MAITRDTLAQLRALRVQVGRAADDTSRALTGAWVRAWDEIAAALDDAIRDAVGIALALQRWPSARELARIETLAKALFLAEQHLAALADHTTAATVAAATAAIRATLAAEPAIIASQLPAPMRADTATALAGRLPATALEAMVARTTQQITAASRPLSAAATEAMRRELIRGIAVGANPRETAARMLTRVEGAFNGGLTRALTIARTETLDAYRTASRTQHLASSDVLSGWTWLATLDKRTCPACWSRHGSEHPLSEPGPLDHQQGRCARLPKAKTWRELGIALDEPDDVLPDARTRFDQLAPADQLAVMGPARLELLRSGAVRWEDLAARRSTSGWRDSYVPRPVRDLPRLATT